MIRKLLPLVLAIPLPGCSEGHTDDVPPPPENATAMYYPVEGTTPALPGLGSLRLSVLPGSRADLRWARWDVFSDEHRMFGFALESPRAGLFDPWAGPVGVERYLLIPEGGPPVEYVDASTGLPALPVFADQAGLLPRAWHEAPTEERLPTRIEWMGTVFMRSQETPAAAPDPDAREIVRLELDNSTLVATSRDFTDDGTGRSGEPLARGGRDFRWHELDGTAYDTMIDVGMNLFRVPEKHLPYVVNEPVFFMGWQFIRTDPSLLWRSNYLGPVMYMDEPVLRLFSQGVFREAQRPEAAAELLLEVTRGRFEGDTGYGKRFLHRMLTRAGWRWTSKEILQPSYPVWEAAIDGVWYEAEAGVGGICYQARFQPREFSDLVRSVLDVRFPDDTDACILFHYAFLRGAARRFSIPWGIGIYGQIDSESADRAFPLAFDRGATYFWLWTSDGEHHVPHERQLDLTAGLQRHQAGATGGGSRIEATTALVVPWGYPVGDYALRSPGRGQKSALWQSPALALDRPNAAGVPYRAVLVAFYREASELLVNGEEFDVLHLRPGQPATGYGRVVRIDEDGSVGYR